MAEGPAVRMDCLSHSAPTAPVLVGRAMADRGVDLSALPKEVRDQLAELDLELSEGKGGEGADGL
ncbi:Disco-interacting protein 2 -like protein B-A [Takifugu flavidus]|uniref:Disco-interacting protein 2-like protein B-A n=1 Tax=Takifugu flavidus TaxID=433684 RepID=A0A5C6MR08_9TELE|nr:Disco-interacting protein 2 -like protein B-A [Takifugu flavidus]